MTPEANGGVTVSRVSVRLSLVRLGALDPRLVDGILAIVASAGMVGETLFAERASQGSQAVSLVAAAILAAAVAARRAHGWLATPGAAVAFLLQHVAGGRLDDGTTSFIVFIVLFYALAANDDGGLMVASMLVAAGALVALVGLTAHDVASDLAFVTVFLVAPILVGRAIRGRRELMAALRERTRRLERERRESEAHAVEDERARIARELHDVVTHSVSVMTVQASAARRVVAAEPGAAAAALGSVEETGRAALSEMRRLFGVLRPDDDEHVLLPQPTVARADGLAGRFRERGLEVELVVEGEPVALTPGIDLAAYRVLEEALESAIRHEAHRARVLVRYRARELELRVRDDGADEPRPPASGGRCPDGGGDDDQVTAMRERIALYGGRLQAGRRPDGSYGVRAVIPVEAVRA
jgi:signal transduction histidine kinase